MDIEQVPARFSEAARRFNRGLSRGEAFGELAGKGKRRITLTMKTHFL